MNKYKIIALFGPAGSGKDYIVKNLMQTVQGKRYLHEIISYTTRPPRENEKDGIDYHFVTYDEFVKKDFLEYNTFRNWWYGTATEDLDINKINIGVFNVAGIYQLINSNLNKEKVDCLPIYIKTNSKIRLLRQLQRETSPNCDEIIRRYLTDQKDFSTIPFEYKIIENNYNEIQPILFDILDLSKTMGKIN